MNYVKVALLILVVGVLGYNTGKHNADRWYWQHRDSERIDFIVPAPPAPEVYATNMILGGEGPECRQAALCLAADGHISEQGLSSGWKICGLAIDMNAKIITGNGYHCDTSTQPATKGRRCPYDKKNSESEASLYIPDYLHCEPVDGLMRCTAKNSESRGRGHLLNRSRPRAGFQKYRSPLKMKIEITDEALGDFIPFAVFVFKPPYQVMVHVICSAKPSARSVPEVLAKQLLKDVLSEKAQLFLSNPTQKGN